MIAQGEVMPYKRIYHGIKPNIEKNVKILSFQLVVLYIAAFFIARVFLLSSMMPFGIAFFVAAYVILNLEATFITGLMVILGYASTFKQNFAFSHMLVVLVIMIIMLVLKNKDKNKVLRISIYTFFINLIICTGFQYNIISGAFNMFEVIMVMLESTIVMASIYIFSYGMPVYFSNKKRRILSKEELVCLGFILAVMISGMWNIGYSGVYLRNICIYFLVLSAGFMEGPGIGAAWGITLGVISGLSDTAMPVTVGIYGFCGLIAGIFRNSGKLLCAISFIISYVIIMLYSMNNQVVNSFENLFNIFLPILIFLIIPEKRYKKIGSIFVDVKKDIEIQTSYIEKVKDLMDKKLSVLTGTLSGLSEVLSKNIDSELSYKAEINGMVEKLADKVCANCDYRSSCWKKEFYSSYDLFSEVLRIIEKNGRIGIDEIPNLLKNKCIRPNELIKQANYIFEIFRLNNKWKKKLINSKIIVSEQVKGINEIMKSMTEEISTSMDFRSDVEEEIAVALDRNGLIFDDILTIKNGKGKYEVTVYKKPCHDKRECKSQYGTVISRTLGVKMSRENGACRINSEGTICQIRFIEAENYSIITAVSRVSKEDVSGDNYSYGSINNGRYLLALSDGMGSGVKAAIESNITISLLEKFIEAGFDRNTALRAINSVLVLRSSEESFATVDMGLIDLHSGIGEFIKIGSAPTYIKSGMEVDIIKSTSIPAGMLDEIEIESQIIDFKNGDMIIMVSDGVVDANEKYKEMWITKALKEYDSGNPKDISEYLINKAKSYCNDKINDDMTVIVSKIWKLV